MVSRLHFAVRGWSRPIDLSISRTRSARGVEDGAAGHAARSEPSLAALRVPGHANERARSVSSERVRCLCLLLSMS